MMNCFIKRLIVFSFSFIILVTNGDAQTLLAKGEQPQMTVDSQGLIRLIFGESDKIYFATSTNRGSSFSKPIVIGEVTGMHLGMTRGPQLATSKDLSVVTAMDKEGDIHSFILNHKTGKWEKSGKVNDKDGSAPEGLMSVAADENNNFYAVWLDLRNERKNNICFSSLKNKKWLANKFAYTSPESHVCECCKPSIEAKGSTVSIMFRNWLKGSRDLYLTTSKDGGKTFSKAQKLGNGTWPLKGCPMDGGGLSIDKNDQISTAWQRDGIVYYTLPGKAEEKIAEGRHVGLSGDIISWEKGSEILMRKLSGAQQTVGEGTGLQITELKDKSFLAVWEKDNQVVFKKIKG
jgi:hypothetical protein